MSFDRRLVIVIIARRSMLQREGAVTEVLMAAADGTSRDVSIARRSSVA
jgi:hypothetical protein